MGRASVAILDELRSHCLRRPAPERHTNALFSTLIPKLPGEVIRFSSLPRVLLQRVFRYRMIPGNMSEKLKRSEDVKVEKLKIIFF